MGAQHLAAFGRALGELHAPDPDPERGRAQLAGMAHRLRAVRRRHREVVPASVGPLPGGGTFAALPGDRIPDLIAVADHLSPGGLDVRFALLADLSLDGLARRAGP